jgi:hypothetical protein
MLQTNPSKISHKFLEKNEAYREKSYARHPRNVDIPKKDTDIIRTFEKCYSAFALHPRLRGKLFFIRTFVESFPCNFGTVGA